MTNRRSFLLAATLVSLALARPVLAQTAACDALPAEKKPLVKELLSALRPYDGCDETFARCLAAKPPARVVLRLANDICRQVKAGMARKEIEQWFGKRAQTMLPTGPRVQISLEESMCAGDGDAPVTTIVYACARCPFCAAMVTALHAVVTDGKLAGKVRLCFRPFPLKSHPGSTEGGLAMLAAAKLGRFWPFTLLAYQRFDAFCPKILPEWAEAAGMDRAAFERASADPKLRDELVASKQEGLRNKVSSTPSLFIDGRPYLYELQIDAVIDVLEEAHETARTEEETMTLETSDPRQSPESVSLAQGILDAKRAALHQGCILCGKENPIGFRLSFRVVRAGVVHATFPCSRVFQSYPETLHGGVISALMDAAMTNCLFSLGEVAVTAEMTVRYLRPTRLDLPAELVGELRRTAWPLHYVGAELRQEGKILVRAEGKFIDRRAAGGEAE